MMLFFLLTIQLQATIAFLCDPGVIGVSLRSNIPQLHTSPSNHAISSFHRRTTCTSLVPDINIEHLSAVSSNNLPAASSILLASEGESWRQYVPLVVSVGVIIDILLGSPVANLALGPMKRASQKGSGKNSDVDNGGNSLFSGFGNSNDGGASKSKERVDSEAIAQAAIDKARNTLELKRFLEENKTNEQRYEDMRRKIDKQLDEFDES
ncbi:hypothetical protein ACHAWO_009209 [Cyclotella atomus]|jgi:hypothetical protein|uniref:Uncharacterized protein n=1 Tax=Cyclotella atomus TaxID=382360 RepID=A0ABD3P1S3_9STRA